MSNVSFERDLPILKENRMKSLVPGRSFGIAIAGSAALLVAVAVGFGSLAAAQDQSAATTKDLIFARKVLMDSIGTNMDELEGIAGSANVDLAHGRDHADIASVMLMAFPHLFAASSNEWKPNVALDPGTDTFASPDVWTKFADFYKRAMDASKLAYDVSRAQKADDFKRAVAQLRGACDSCHALYYKTPTPP
jgi:cytochrome c556